MSKILEIALPLLWGLQSELYWASSDQQWWLHSPHDEVVQSARLLKSLLVETTERDSGTHGEDKTTLDQNDRKTWISVRVLVQGQALARKVKRDASSLIGGSD